MSANQLAIKIYIIISFFNVKCLDREEKTIIINQLHHENQLIRQKIIHLQKLRNLPLGHLARLLAQYHQRLWHI
jgi:ribosome-binding factor A